MKTHRRLVVLASIWLFAGSATADIVHLRDGSRIEGDIKHTDDGWNVRTRDGKIVHVSPDQVESVELTAGANAGPAMAADRLASIRRSVENSKDLNDIISRFQRFVETCNEPAVSIEAKKDLLAWQDRRNQKMVKVGSKWVLPGERQKLLDQSAASAEQARQLIKQGRSKEAELLLTQALSVDPQNAAALYLVGLLRYQQELIPASRKSLEAVVALVPNHAPTLNNLAVAEWRQKQFVAALGNYDAAMLASPVNKVILDNVASALLALPPELQRSPVTARALRHFQEQDQVLAEQMSQSGMHRYGAIWINDHDMDQMRQQDKLTQNQLDQLAGDFDRVKARIDQLDQNISDEQAQIDRIQATSVIPDARTGIAIQIPLPQVYYDVTAEMQQSQQERATAVTKLDGIKRRADDLHRNRPTQKMSGVQRMIGAEGTPLRLAPATQP